ncbi:MAG: hypothetical protein J5542_04980 [Bacteroidales bacterium]|nr:hypothetical protein [Bacteroidales bacterium]
MDNAIYIINANTIELHYWFKDDSHTMDANVFNQCEHEILDIINELVNKLQVNIGIEVEPLGEGGLKTWLRFIGEQKNAIKIAFTLYLFSEVLLTPLTTTLEYVTTKAIDSFFEDDEIKALEKEKKKADLEYDIAKTKLQTQKLCDSIDENKIKKKRSNFFETASKCKKIDKISITLTDSNKTQNPTSKEVLSPDFSKYIMTSDDVEPDNDENAIIEIVSPVLKKGKYMWTGIYNNIVIQFKMKSSEFMTLVQSGQIPFKNGSSIQCHLITNKKINSDGNVKITSYEVISVDKYFMNDTPIETPEGKRNRQKREAEKMQMEFDFKN